MILLDLFSGIGGFHKGLLDAGIPITKTYFSEIDKHAIANYKYNYPNATHIGTVTDILNAGIERPDIITFGSPCQDFSLAGKRAGLGGDRSSLIEYAVSAVAHFRPTVFIWENVKGTFSSNGGADFWAILQRFAHIGNYQLEWQLLNTKWVLPQNRERIYLVGRIAERCRGEIFPIGEDDELFDKQTKSNGGRTQTDIYGTLKQGFGNKADDTFVKVFQRNRGKNKGGMHDECPTISANAFEQNNHVQIGTYRNYKNEKGIREMKNGLSPTITGNASRKYGGNPVITIKESIQKNECENERNTYNFLSILRKEIGEKKVAEWGLRILNSLQKEKILRPTLYGGSIQEKGEKRETAMDDSSLSRKKIKEKLLREMWENREFGCSSHKWGLAGQFFDEFTNSVQKLPYTRTSICKELQNMSGTILCERILYKTLSEMEKVRKPKNGKNKPTHADSIRRLTPIECEILQGYTPNYTKYGNYDGTVKEIPATQRYKMLGNAVTAKIVELTGTRIKLNTNLQTLWQKGTNHRTS